MVSGEELSLFGSTANSTESVQKFFSFTVRDSLINIGPLKDLSYGLRNNYDVNVTGIARHSNYELVLETADNLMGVTESVDYYAQGRTIAGGNLFGRCRVVQVFERGAHILDGSFMTQDLSFGAPNSESGPGSESSIVSSVSIAVPYVLNKNE